MTRQRERDDKVERERSERDGEGDAGSRGSGCSGKGTGQLEFGEREEEDRREEKGGFKLNRFKRTGFPLNRPIRFSWIGLVFSGVWPGSSTSDIPLFFLAFPPF